MAELGTKFLETQKVGVQTAAPYLVASGFGNDGFAHSCQ